MSSANVYRVDLLVGRGQLLGGKGRWGKARGKCNVGRVGGMMSHCSRWQQATALGGHSPARASRGCGVLWGNGPAGSEGSGSLANCKTLHSERHRHNAWTNAWHRAGSVASGA